MSRVVPLLLVGLLCTPACSGGGDKESGRPASDSTTTEAPTTTPPIPCEADDVASWSSVTPIPVTWGYRCYFNAYSSLTGGDLNGDGLPDVIVNDVRNDAERRLVALDGATGAQLWQGREQVLSVTSVGLGDLNGDDVPDVVATSRGEPVTDRPIAAADGRDGSTLWVVAPLDPPWQNVFAPQATGDIDDDGVVDWVVATGGDDGRKPQERPKIAGRLVAVSGADGSIVGSVAVPDGQEVYSSPIVIEQASGSRELIVGSGGEVFPGSLWRIPLADVVAGDDSGFVPVLSGADQSSFIAPPTSADVDGDGTADLVVSRLDGTLIVVDPLSKDGKGVRWSTPAPSPQLPRTDDGERIAVSETVPAIGQLDADPALEIVSTYKFVTKDALSTGAINRGEMLYVVQDGATGAVESSKLVLTSDSIASPLLLRRGSDPTVVCVCADHEEGARLGLWNLRSQEIQDLGLSMLDGATPVLLQGSAPGGVRLAVTVRQVDGSGDHAALSLELPDSESLWGGYLGPGGTGRLVLPTPGS